ncbi:MAG: hypothetical protein ABRQ26_10660 [Syntrophomonadaceae bacterium]
MAMVLKEQGQASTAQVLRVVTNNVGSPYWPRVTMGTPVEWMVEDTVGNARAALEGLMDLWPRVTMGTVNTDQSGEPVSHAAFAPWPRYTLGTGNPGIESESVESGREQRAELLAEYLSVWPRITLASM